jgi:hypothetical protein
MLIALGCLPTKYVSSFKLALVPVAAAMLAVVIVALDIRSPLSPETLAICSQANYYESSAFYQALTPGGVPNGAAAPTHHPAATASTGGHHDSDSSVLSPDFGTPIQNAILDYEPGISSSVFAVFYS